MGAAQIREELHQFIDRADERVLNQIHGMIKSAGDVAILTEVQQRDLDMRVGRHKRGESKSYTWSEARAQIEKSK